MAPPGSQPKDKGKATGTPTVKPDVGGSGPTGPGTAPVPATTPATPVVHPATPTRAQLAHAPVSNAVRAARSRRAAAAIHARNAPKPEPGLVRDYEIVEDLLEGVAEAVVYPTRRQVAAALDEVVELKGKGKLAVSDLHRELIVGVSPRALPVNVKFGDIARGAILVAANQDGELYTIVDCLIPFRHPELPPLDAPWLLALTVKQDHVYGLLAADWGGAVSPVDERNAQRLLGLEDLQDLQAGTFVNKLVDGHLDFGYRSMKYFFDGLFEGSGALVVSNDAPVKFSAKADVETEGVKKQEVSIVRDVLGQLGAKVDLGADYVTPEGYKLGGQLQARFDRGVVDIRGTLQYDGGAAKGDVTVMIADEETAWAAVRQRLGDKAPPVIEKMDSPNGLAFVGWGTVNFAVNEWLTGDAQVVLDPDGYVTAMGSLRPTVKLTLFDKREKGPTDVIPPEKFSVWIPQLALRLGLILRLTKTYFVGPGTLSEIEVDGVFSTRPHVPTEFHVSGLFLIPAHADLSLSITGEAALIGIAGVAGRLSGIASLDAHAFVRPHIGRRRHGSDPSKAVFYVGGYMGAEAALSLGFAGKIGVVVHTPWPLPDVEWFPLDTGPKLWTVGSARISVEGDYVLGDMKDPKTFDYQVPKLNTEFLKSALMKQDLSVFEDGSSRTSDVHTNWLDRVSAAEEPKAESIAPAGNQPSEIEPTPTIAMPEIPSHEAAAVLPPPPEGTSGSPATTTTVPGQEPDKPPPPAAPPTGPTLAPGVTTPPPSEPDPTLAPGLPPIVAPFMMLDTPHTLYLVREAKPYILMASPQIDRLRIDLGIAINVVGQELRNAVDGVTVEDPTDPTREIRTVKDLDEELKELQSILNSCDKVEWSAVWEAPKGQVSGLPALVARLGAYATLFNRRDLIKSIRNLPARVVPRAPGQVSSGRRITAFQSLLEGDPARAVKLQKDYDEYERDRRSTGRGVMPRADYLEMRARFILGYEAERPSISLYTLETGLNVEKNSRTIYLSMPNDPQKPRRIPDVYVPGLVIADIKNVGHQRRTSQMIDDAAIADLKPGDFFYDEAHTQTITQPTGRFDLVVRAPWHERGPTHVENDVKALVSRRHGDIYELIEDPGEPEHED